MKACACDVSAALGVDTGGYKGCKTRALCFKMRLVAWLGALLGSLESSEVKENGKRVEAFILSLKNPSQGPEVNSCSPEGPAVGYSVP